MSTQCSQTKTDGTPCKAWAVRGSNPPRCSSHGGGKGPVGAPKGNKNAEKHGVYAGDPPPDDLGLRIADLGRKIERLSQYIDDEWHDLQLEQRETLLRLHAQMNGQLGRLKRARLIVEGEVSGGLQADVDEALVIVSRVLGKDFTG